MSQTLALIVAASVLMMTALTVIVMVTGGLSDTDQGVTSSSCLQTVQFRCDASNEINAPPNCFSEGEPVANAPAWGSATGPGDPVECNNIGY